MNRKVVAVLAAVLVLFVGYYVASPYVAVRNLRAAGVSGDVDDLNEAVDFPAVRESVKSQMMTLMTAKMQNDPAMRDNPFAGLGQMMAPAIVGQMVDRTINADGMAMMVRQGKLKRDVTAKPAAETSYDYDYRGLDRFAVAIRPEGSTAKEPLTLILHRRGVFSWQVVRIELPADALAN